MRAPSRARVALDVLRGGRRHSYAGHRWARCELHRPRGAGPFPVAVVIHGGSWHAGYGKVLMRPVCRDLVRRGWAAWNIEYRRLGGRQGGGWPATFDDVATAIDALPGADERLDLDRVVFLGHSAGGHLALWAAGTTARAPELRPAAVVAQAPMADLERGDGPLVHALLGGTPAEQPERYAQANPARQVPLRMPELLVHGADDATVGVQQSRRYAAAARAAGGAVELVEPPGRHRDHIDPRSPAWAAAAERLDTLAG